MKNKKLIFLILLILAAMALAAFLAVQWAERKVGVPEDDYMAVQLTNGQLYIGRIEWFPRPHLTHVWLVERLASPEPGGPEFNLRKFTESVFEPEDSLYFSDDAVLWTAPLRRGEVWKALQGNISNK